MQKRNAALPRCRAAAHATTTTAYKRCPPAAMCLRVRRRGSAAFVNRNGNYAASNWKWLKSYNSHALCNPRHTLTGAILKFLDNF
jgi:hypothetical protein